MGAYFSKLICWSTYSSTSLSSAYWETTSGLSVGATGSLAPNQIEASSISAHLFFHAFRSSLNCEQGSFLIA